MMSQAGDGGKVTCQQVSNPVYKNFASASSERTFIDFCSLYGRWPSSWNLLVFLCNAHFAEFWVNASQL